MKNLIWQFHKHANRVRDGEDSIAWASASAELLVNYAMRHGVEYRYAVEPHFWQLLPGVGPGHERFQVFSEDFDTYDFILYVDTDILFSANAPNLFEIYGNCDIASFNWPNPQDLKIFTEGGWLSHQGFTEQFYRSRYVAGGLYLMSRRFRQTMRPHVFKAPYNNNTGLPLSHGEFSAKFPCGDQSILSFLLCFYDLKYEKFPHTLTRGPEAYNFCGSKTAESLTEYFERYNEYSASWRKR